MANLHYPISYNPNQYIKLDYNYKNIMQKLLLRLNTIFTFSKVRQITVRNLFNSAQIDKYTSLTNSDLLKVLESIKSHQEQWRTSPSQQKDHIIKDFYQNIRQEHNVAKISRLLSECTGKEMLECQHQMRLALKIFNYQNSSSYIKRKQYQNGLGQKNLKDYYMLEPFNSVLNVFDHRNPIISTLKYFALALQSNNFLLLRPSYYVLPVVKAIQNIWHQNSKIPLMKTLVDTYLDPKHQKSPIKTILQEADSFISFSGRIKDGFDFHYYVSKESQIFRQDQYLLTSCDSAYVLKDLSKQQLKKSVQIIARGCFSNCGHNFNSIKRVFLDRQISQSFLASFIEESQRYSISQALGEGKQSTNDGLLAPFLLQSQYTEGLAKLKDLQQKYQQEFTLLQGGTSKQININNSTLNFINPSIFLTKNDFPDYNYQNQEYMFPVCFISIVDSVSSCVQKINSSIYGITSSIFTSNNSLQAVESMGQKIDVGTINVNTWQMTDGITYSGRKRSGKGFSISPLSFNNIVMAKSVSYN